MKKHDLITKTALWVGRGVAVVLAALLFLLPAIMDRYTGFRFMSQGDRVLVTVAFYCCVVFIGWALWNMDRLLRNILVGQVFVRKNVYAVR